MVRTRELEKKDLESVSSLCMKAFMESIASGLSDKGVETFQSIASVEGFTTRMHEDNTILVCEEGETIAGVIELKKGRHVVILFVAPEWQGKGVGRALVSAIKPYTKTDTITVNASLNSIEAYTRYGFSIAGDSDEKFGLKYQPMELKY